MSTKIITGVVVGLCAVAIGAMMYGTSQRNAAGTGEKIINSTSLNKFEPVNITSTVAGLPQKVDGKVLVVDVFNYGCSHCAVIHTLNDEVYKRNANNIKLVKISAPFAHWNQYTHLFYALDTLGIESQLSDDIFKAIHEDNKRDLSLGSDALAKILHKHNVSIEAFTKAYNDPSIPEKVAQSLEILKAYNVESTPTMIVDNERKFSPSINQGYAEASLSMENAIKDKVAKLPTK